MKAIIAGGAIIHGNLFIRITDGQIPIRLIDKNLTAKYLADPVIVFNDDKSLSIKGVLVKLCNSKKRVYISKEEAAENYPAYAQTDFFGRKYLEGWYSSAEDNLLYEITIQEPWFIDFSNYTFRGV